MEGIPKVVCAVSLLIIAFCFFSSLVDNCDIDHCNCSAGQWDEQGVHVDDIGSIICFWFLHFGRFLGFKWLGPCFYEERCIIPQNIAVLIVSLSSICWFVLGSLCCRCYLRCGYDFIKWTLGILKRKSRNLWTVRFATCEITFVCIWHITVIDIHISKWGK